MLWPSLLAIIGLALLAPAAFAETAADSVRAGNSLYSESKYEEALKKYKAAQVESPTDERIMFNLGNAQYKLGQHNEALSGYLRAAQSANPEIQAQSHYNSGNALYRMGRLEDAVEQYLKALEIDPDDEDAKFNLEFVRQEIRRRMNEQQQRQEERQDKEDKGQVKKEPDGKDSAEQKDQQSRQQSEDSQKEPARQENEHEQSTGREKDTKTEHSPGADQGERQRERQVVPEQGMGEENLQRWLDAIEAETAENTKEFLRRQQSGEAIAYPKDW
ncbi:MAG: tetratricopeptide repeat protein [Candidatus Hydrogenedentota bacterium]|nr:MAG: tetratricopeptide repeat protein [Candidatus Hydrogenedentota bacterium]